MWFYVNILKIARRNNNIWFCGFLVKKLFNNLNLIKKRQNHINKEIPDILLDFEESDQEIHIFFSKTKYLLAYKRFKFLTTNS